MYVEHPQTNGESKATNKEVLIELKRWLGSPKGRWVEELLELLWGYRCTPPPHFVTQETSFRLVYEIYAMVPVEVGDI